MGVAGWLGDRGQLGSTAINERVFRAKVAFKVIASYYNYSYS